MGAPLAPMAIRGVAQMAITIAIGANGRQWRSPLAQLNVASVQWCQSLSPITPNDPYAKLFDTFAHFDSSLYQVSSPLYAQIVDTTAKQQLH